MDVITPMDASGICTDSIKETRKVPPCQLGNRLIGGITRNEVFPAFFIVPFIFGKGHKINPAQPPQQPGEIKHNFAHKIPHFRVLRGLPKYYPQPDITIRKAGKKCIILVKLMYFIAVRKKKPEADFGN